MADKTWLKQPTKSALLSVLKRGAELDVKTLSKVFDGVLFKSEFNHAATGGTVDHTELSSIGTKSHTVIDAHINNALIHFTEASIDHTAILNVGTNSHAAIDLHIGTGSIHFTEGSIDHGSITGLGDDDHSLYLLASDATSRASFATNWFDLTDGGDTILHIHDTRYYTKTETVSITTILADGTSAPVTVNLPEASTVTGYIYNIKAINISNAVTISTFGTEQIDGSSSDIVLTLMKALMLQSDGSNWWIL